MRLPFSRKSELHSRPKIYLYVSDAKVDMLTEGLGRPLRDRLDLTVKASIPEVAGVEAASRHVEAGRYERAERLCKALIEQGRVGDVFDDDKEFIRGTMLSVWGFWAREDGGYADVVFFTALGEDNTMVGLGGSAYHTVERSADRLQKCSNSGLQVLMEFLKERSENTGPGKHRWQPPDAWYAETGAADHDNEAVPEEIEFVAQRLLARTAGDYRYIIGSPIYVARTGRPTTPLMLKEYSAARDRYSLSRYSRRRMKPFDSRWQLGSRGRWQLGGDSHPVIAPLLEPNKE